jgi:hypothetical protein
VLDLIDQLAVDRCMRMKVDFNIHNKAQIVSLSLCIIVY